MKNVILLLILASSFLSCETDQIELEEGPVEVVLLASGSLDGDGAENIPEQNIVIGDENTWNALLAQMNTVNYETNDFVETDVDFQNFLVIASFEEIKPTAGFNVEISGAVQNANNMTVSVTKTQPEDGDIVLPGITQPYNIVKVLRTYTPIVFE